MVQLQLRDILSFYFPKMLYDIRMGPELWIVLILLLLLVSSLRFAYAQIKIYKTTKKTTFKFVISLVWASLVVMTILDAIGLIPE